MSRRASSPFKRPESPIRCKEEIAVIKIIKEIERGVERLKLFSSITFNPDKSLIEKGIIVHRLVHKLDDCKILISKGGVSEEIIELYRMKVSLVRSLSIQERILVEDIINESIDNSEEQLLVQELRGENLEKEIKRQSIRSENIISLSQDVVQINEMFRDLYSMIENQGEEINRIEKTVEEVNTKVQKGNELIKEAEVMQDRGFKAKLITGFFVVVAAIGTVIGIKSH
ncbi:MAG: hypothetical protein PHG66_04800 [Candidatus Colwellbacteria bacterium]|nr:hypothetical protein [Candidatus Colwellbacteria bacterium]